MFLFHYQFESLDYFSYDIFISKFYHKLLKELMDFYTENQLNFQSELISVLKFKYDDDYFKMILFSLMKQIHNH